MSTIRLPWVLALLLVQGCALARGPTRGAVPPLHLSALEHEGDAARRASLQLTLEGLDADVLAQPDRALDLYQRSLQVDPGNAWAYLALARHHADGPRPEHALAFVERTRALLQARGELTPGAEAHLSGLRGQILVALGRDAEGLALLEHARRLAPHTWSDGRLSAEELR